MRRPRHAALSAQVVFEMSKGSAHFAEQQRRDARTSETIGVLRARAVRLELGPLQSRADRLVAELEGARALDGVWACVDLDAFFASVEELKDPSLKDTPFAVGGLGMISTANYVARKFGVRSAMPGFIGRKLCPQLRFVPGDFESYRKYSALAMQARQHRAPQTAHEHSTEHSNNLTKHEHITHSTEHSTQHT